VLVRVIRFLARLVRVRVGVGLVAVAVLVFVLRVLVRVIRVRVGVGLVAVAVLVRMRVLVRVLVL
jgi:hypothetical protein